MLGYKDAFIEFMVRSAVLTFGKFKTKSGRDTPFFINTGNFKTGSQLWQLGSFYAEAIINNVPKESFNVLFGSAYKGIPLVAATSIELARRYDKDCGYCFNRKETKDHGEGGQLIGHKPVSGDRIFLVDDVITAGTSTREAVNLLRSLSPEASVVGGIVSVDRMERGADGGKSAIQSAKEQFGFDIFSIVTLDEIVTFLHNREIDGKVVLDDDILKAINAYREQWGIEK